MANTINDRKNPLTFQEAEKLSAFELAALWADRMSWPLPVQATAHDDLAELACMSALAAGLARWRPIQIHRAILAGAEPEAVAAALGSTVEDAFACWHVWATEQRTPTRYCAQLGVTDKDYKAATDAFAAAGVIAYCPSTQMP